MSFVPMPTYEITFYNSSINLVMNLIILGSGGCTPIPRPGCTCPVCEEAREEGIPYARTGPSLFLEDINALFDTPEDVCQQLTRETIQTVNHIFYTHWHPDHTLGMRIVEQMNRYYLEQCIGRKLPSKKDKHLRITPSYGRYKSNKEQE